MTIIITTAFLTFIALVALSSIAYASGKRDGAKESQKAHELGYAQGEEKGYANGYTDGYKHGHVVGGNEGYTQGKEEGFADGKRYGASIRYNEEALKEMGVDFGKFEKL